MENVLVDVKPLGKLILTAYGTSYTLRTKTEQCGIGLSLASKVVVLYGKEYTNVTISTKPSTSTAIITTDRKMSEKAKGLLTAIIKDWETKNIEDIKKLMKKARKEELLLELEQYKQYIQNIYIELDTLKRSDI